MCVKTSWWERVKDFLISFSSSLMGEGVGDKRKEKFKESFIFRSPLSDIKRDLLKYDNVGELKSGRISFNRLPLKDFYSNRILVFNVLSNSLQV